MFLFTKDWFEMKMCFTKGWFDMKMFFTLVGDSLRRLLQASGELASHCHGSIEKVQRFRNDYLASSN